MVDYSAGIHIGVKVYYILNDVREFFWMIGTLLNWVFPKIGVHQNG